MTGLTCDKCGKEVEKLSAPIDASRWICNDCKNAPDPTQRLREIVERVERGHHEQSTLDPGWEPDALTLARFAMEVLEEYKQTTDLGYRAATEEHAAHALETEGGK